MSTLCSAQDFLLASSSCLRSMNYCDENIFEDNRIKKRIDASREGMKQLESLRNKHYKLMDDLRMEYSILTPACKFIPRNKKIIRSEIRSEYSVDDVSPNDTSNISHRSSMSVDSGYLSVSTDNASIKNINEYCNRRSSMIAEIKDSQPTMLSYSNYRKMSIEENKSYEMSTEEKKCYEVSSEEKKSYQMPTEERKSYEMVVEKKKWYEMPLVATVKPLEKNIQTNMSSSTMGTVKKLAMNYAKNLQDKNKSSSDLVATVLETTAVLRPSRQSKNQNRPWSMYTTATETVDAEPKHYTDDLTEDLLNNNETIRKYSTLTKSNKTEQQDKFDSHIYSIPNKKPSSYQSNLGDFGEYSKAYQKPPIQKQPQQSNNIRSLAQSFENQNNHNVRKSLNNIALSNSSSTRNLHIAQPNIVVTRFSDNINSTFNKSVPSRKIGMVVGAATPPNKRIQKGWLESEGL